jgi:hypothetical protein
VELRDAVGRDAGHMLGGAVPLVPRNPVSSLQVRVLQDQRIDILVARRAGQDGRGGDDAVFAVAAHHRARRHFAQRAGVRIKHH